MQASGKEAQGGGRVEGTITLLSFFQFFRLPSSLNFLVAPGLRLWWGGGAKNDNQASAVKQASVRRVDRQSPVREEQQMERGRRLRAGKAFSVGFIGWGEVSLNKTL